MDKTLKNGLIFLSVGMIIYIGYLVFLGTALSHSLWNHEWFSILASILLGLSLIAPLIALSAIGIIQIQKAKKYTTTKLALLIITLIAVPASSLMVLRYIDKQNYEITYTFSPTKWMQASTRDRSILIHSFREQYNLVGENIDLATDLLGEPDIREDFQYVYDLGDFETMLAFDPYYYLIAFDMNDIITSEGIFQG